MNFKKTFWMNVLLATLLPFLYYLSYATDIDYNYREHPLSEKIFTASTQLLYLATPILTAIHLYKPNLLLLRKLALFGNYCSVIVIVLYLLAVVLPAVFAYIDFLVIALGCSIFLLPFLINLKIMKRIMLEAD